MSFDTALRHVFAAEGGGADHPLDHGGPTHYGITQTAYTAWLGTQGLPPEPVKFISRDDATRIYHDQYWLKARCDKLQEPVSTIHFDAAVNHGVARSIRMLQACVNVTQDAVMGPCTLRAVRKIAPSELAKTYIQERERFYRAIVVRDESQAVFLKGWLSRLARLPKE